MAEEQPILTDPSAQDTADHVRDYARFVQLFKWGAIISVITGFLVLMIIT